MPIYMEISRLHRTVTIVARGKIEPDEIRGMAIKLAAEKVRSFAKIIEVAAANTEFTLEQIVRLAEMMRGASTEKRGPIAFVVDTAHTAFPQAFAVHTENEGPIRLFTSLREARRWTEQILHAPPPRDEPATPAPVRPPQGQNAWTDPNRQGVLIRGSRQRDVTVGPLDSANAA
jgi:hypothetical protein